LLLATAGALAAQTQPHIENANFQPHASAGPLTAEFATFGSGPWWAAWEEPIIPGRHGDMCDHAAVGPVRLEGQTSLLILVRVENGRTDQLRVASPDCSFDGGGLPFHWLTGVAPAESVAWLKTQLSDTKPDRALLAIALHAGPAAGQALDELTAPAQAEHIRSRAAFWLGSTRGSEGVQTLKRMLAHDPSPAVREQAVFGLSVSNEPSATAALIDTAKNDSTPRIRGRALFWLAQKAGNKQTQDLIHSAILNDPERAVKEQAVFALKQLPRDEGIPLLIDVAKNNPDPAIRKKAMFWLGESKDPRALEFFAQVLAKQ
jgi:hypothetical protein